MSKKVQGWALLASLLLVSGCATTGGRNYQADIDALNARVTALQGQLESKDKEISSLQNQVSDQRMAKETAETAMRQAEEEKRALQNAETKRTQTVPSDLK